MNFCLKCNETIPEGISQCPKCGSKVIEHIEAYKMQRINNESKLRVLTSKEKINRSLVIIVIWLITIGLTSFIFVFNGLPEPALFFVLALEFVLLVKISRKIWRRNRQVVDTGEELYYYIADGNIVGPYNLASIAKIGLSDETIIVRLSDGNQCTLGCLKSTNGKAITETSEAVQKVDMYYFLEGTTIKGPVDLEQLLSMKLADDTLVKTDEMAEWITLRELNKRLSQQLKEIRRMSIKLVALKAIKIIFAVIFLGSIFLRFVVNPALEEKAAKMTMQMIEKQKQDEREKQWQRQIQEDVERSMVQDRWSRDNENFEQFEDAKTYKDGDLSFSYPSALEIEKNVEEEDCHKVVFRLGNDIGVVVMYNIMEYSSLNHKREFCKEAIKQEKQSTLEIFPKAVMGETKRISNSNPVVKYSFDFKTDQCLGGSIVMMGDKYQMIINYFAVDEEDNKEIKRVINNIRIK